jgi:uncharacterized protein (TIGR02271 family)
MKKETCGKAESDMVEARRENNDAVVVVVPVHEERAAISKDKAEQYRVRVTKRVETHDERVEAEATRDDVRVETVTVNRVVVEPPPVRQEGTTTIVPILEERLVVQKELVLREELRITRTPIRERRAMNTTLRREVVEVLRIEGKEERK